MRQTIFGRAKSIASAALLGFGIFIPYETLQTSHLLGTTPGSTPGALPVFLAALQTLQASAPNQQWFLQGFFQHLLASLWPLMLIIVGMVLSQDNVTDSVSAFPKKDCGLVDLTAGRSTFN